MRGNDTAEAHIQYRNSLRTCRTLIRTRERNYEKQIVHKVKSNQKKFVTYIRKRKKATTNIAPLKDETGSLTQDRKHMAKILNSNFASVFTTDNKETIPEDPAQPRGKITPLEIDAIFTQDVIKYLD